VKFGPVPVGEALGGIVAHAIRRDGLVLKKGELLDAARIDALKTAGVSEIVIARLETGDIGEDEAARLLADAIAGPQLRIEKPFTGRSNLFAASAGVLMLDAAALDRVNEIDERVTVATLPAFRAVVAGEMIATVKIIPFAAPGAVIDRAISAARDVGLRVAPYRPTRVSVISTLLPGLKSSVIAKTLRVMNERLAPAGAAIAQASEVPHEAAPLAEAIRSVAGVSDLIVVFGASAITDRRDVIPTALEAAGGQIDQFGMPVDPGNLLLLGHIGEGAERKIVLGAPGCARSPKENGFDWVLQRLLAGVPVNAADIRRMGAGGLLMEIISRGQPRGGESPVDADHDGDG
jgi:molybdenum cofactor cytidylyltransferase